MFNTYRFSIGMQLMQYNIYLQIADDVVATRTTVLYKISLRIYSQPGVS